MLEGQTGVASPAGFPLALAFKGAGMPDRNIDETTVAGFGEEWSSYTQEHLDPVERKKLFDQYFSVFPFDELPPEAEGFDMGCGTGRWAALVADRVGHLHCIDPADKALAVARRLLDHCSNISVHHCDVDSLPLNDDSQDFGYSIGVLHHIPDTEAAIKSCVRKLKSSAPFLVYIYYDFDNRAPWFRAIWRVSDMGRTAISRLPFPARKALTTLIAALVYWPLATTARAFERAGRNVSNLPLSEYRYRGFYSMRTDALDRFGTRLEHRFSKAEIQGMMQRAGLKDIHFRHGPPYWVACGRKA